MKIFLIRLITLLFVVQFVQQSSYAQIYESVEDEDIKSAIPVMTGTNIEKNLIATSYPVTSMNDNNIIYDEFEARDIRSADLTTLGGLNQDDTSTKVNLSVSKGIEKVPLETAIATALQNNLDIKIAKTRSMRDKWRYYLAIGNHLPDAELSYSHSRFSGTTLVQGLIPVSINQTNIVPAFTLSAGLDGLGSIFNTLSQRNTFKAAKNQEQLTIEEVIMQTVQNYNDLLKDKMEILVRDRSLERAKTQLKLNELRLEAGVGTRFDVARSQAQLAQEEQRLISAYSTLHTNSLKLNEVMGYDLLTEIIPDETYVEKVTLLESNLTVDELLSLAMENRKDIARDQKAVNALKDQMKGMIASSVLPTVNVSGRIAGSGQHLNAIQRNQSISLEMTLPTGRNMGTEVIMNQRSISAQLKEAEYTLQKTISSVKRDVLTTHYKIQSIKSIIDAAEKEVEASQESLKLALMRLDAGVGTNSDLIDAQVQETTSKIRHIDAIIDYNTAQTELLFRLGALSIDTAFNGYKPMPHG